VSVLQNQQNWLTHWQQGIFFLGVDVGLDLVNQLLALVAYTWRTMAKCQHQKNIDLKKYKMNKWPFF
jgi:hypothetical protein